MIVKAGEKVRLPFSDKDIEIVACEECGTMMINTEINVNELSKRDLFFIRWLGTRKPSEANKEICTECQAAKETVASQIGVSAPRGAAPLTVPPFPLFMKEMERMLKGFPGW